MMITSGLEADIGPKSPSVWFTDACYFRSNKQKRHELKKAPGDEAHPIMPDSFRMSPFMERLQAYPGDRGFSS